MTRLPVVLIGDGTLVACIDGQERAYVALDAAASTGVLAPVLRRVEEFLPSCSAVHRGAGYKSQLATQAYESAREAALSFAGREGRDDIAIICRNTTEAINHLAYRRACVRATSWSPLSSNTTPISCRGRARPRAAMSSAGPSGPSRLPV